MDKQRKQIDVIQEQIELCRELKKKLSEKKIDSWEQFNILFGFIDSKHEADVKELFLDEDKLKMLEDSTRLRLDSLLEKYEFELSWILEE